MTAALYTSLRDETAATLIKQFGSGAVLRKQDSTYDVGEGETTHTTADTPVQVLEVSLSAMLRGAQGKNQYSDDLVRQWDSGVIISAKETNTAGVEPEPEDILVIGGRQARIKWVEPVAPGGIAVIYKAAIARL